MCYQCRGCLQARNACKGGRPCERCLKKSLQCVPVHPGVNGVQADGSESLVSAGPDYQDPLVMINARLFRALVNAPSNIGHSCFPRLLTALPSLWALPPIPHSSLRRAGASPPNGSPPPLSRRRLAPPFLTTLIKAKQLYQFSSLNTVQTPLPSLPKYLKIIQSDIGLLSE